MLQRTSKVEQLKVDSGGLASVVQVGDSNVVTSFSRTLAVQRKVELFFANEGDFNAYKIFTRSIPLYPIEENLTIHTRHEHPLIKVECIDVIGVSAASILHIGSSDCMQMETRIKHFRQLQSSK